MATPTINDLRKTFWGSTAAELAALQTAVSNGGTAAQLMVIMSGAGAPNNALGLNGWIYIRSDGAALTTIYHKRAGAWVGVV